MSPFAFYLTEILLFCRPLNYVYFAIIYFLWNPAQFLSKILWSFNKNLITPIYRISILSFTSSIYIIFPFSIFDIIYSSTYQFNQFLKLVLLQLFSVSSVSYVSRGLKAFLFCFSFHFNFYYKLQYFSIFTSNIHIHRFNMNIKL